MPKGVKGFQKGNKDWTRWRSRPDYSGEKNPNYGNKYSEEIRRKISENTPNKGENHKDWKGDNVGYYGLHGYIKKHLPKPILCQRCNTKKAIDLSSNGKYTRELSDWEWLCRKCHYEKDGRGKFRDDKGRFIEHDNTREIQPIQREHREQLRRDK